MNTPEQPQQIKSSWSFALSLLLTGSALASHPLWLPQLKEAYGSSERYAGSGCRHSSHQKAQVAIEPWTLPLRAPLTRPNLAALIVPKLSLTRIAPSISTRVAFSVPTPKFVRPTFEYGLPGQR